MTVLVEPRAAYTVRLGTCASRSPRSLMFSLSRVSGVNAVTATGTSCRVSSRLRAVTLTESSVVALVAGVSPAGAASGAHATGTDDNKTQPMTRLRCLRFMGLPSSRV